jgi:hypothetical protein
MRRRSRTAMVALTTLLALAFALPATSAAAEMGKIRAFHDSPDTPAVDIWVNGAHGRDLRDRQPIPGRAPG